MSLNQIIIIIIIIVKISVERTDCMSMADVVGGEV